MTHLKTPVPEIFVTGPDAVSALSKEAFAQYISLIKANTLESIANANAIWPEAREDAKKITEMLRLISAEPCPQQRREILSQIDAAELRIQEIQEKVSSLQAAKHRLQTQLTKLKNSPAIQQTSPLHGVGLRISMNNLVLKAAVSPELKAAGLL